MARTLLNRARIVQNAYVVDDLDEACARLNRIYGIGPFLGNRRFRLPNFRYRGELVEPVEMSAVFAQSGDMNIELIQQHSTGPSAFRDMFGAGEQGLHHVAVFCDDYPAERDAFVAAGYPVASEFGAGPETMICYVDTRAALGHMIELYTDNPGIRGRYEQTRCAALDWDGATLIRPFG